MHKSVETVRFTVRLKGTTVAILACVLLSAIELAAQNQTFKGAIMDSMCAAAKGHSAMLKPGESAADCTLACVKAGAKFVLFNAQNNTVYQLSDQAKPKAFAGRNVLVVGSLDRATGTVRVSDVLPALSAKLMQAKSVYVDCDSCVRGMTKANSAAVESLADWKRFTVVGDPKKADLVFLFSSNKYLGDYLTRKGPDTRPVAISTTYMDVLDPHTGFSLWSDSSRSGSWRVAGATKELIGEFRARLEAEEGHAGRLLRRSEKPAPVSPDDSGFNK